MITIVYKGRTGNNLFQYIAAYIFARKFNFKINTPVVKNIFNLPLLQGTEAVSKTIYVGNNNYMSLLESDTLKHAHYIFVGYYQIKDFISKYKEQIKSLFTLSYTETNKDDVFVAYRIGDMEGKRSMLPLEYYQHALRELNAKSGFIASDTMDHPNVIHLIKEFTLKPYNNTPLEQINFAKNFNNLVLSEGTFSWWIGFLSQAQNIYYNLRPRFWHGDIFVMPDWKPLEYDWHPSCVESRRPRMLRCTKVIAYGKDI